MKTDTLETAEADIVYDVEGPLPTADGRPVLFMVGQPMDASGFRTLASYFPDRTVITYDPRGLGRSLRKDGKVDNVPTVQADDVHAVIRTLDVGPVEMFASSGGAVTALALVAAHPNEVTVLVAHEPPMVQVLPDAEAAERAVAQFRDAYAARGWGFGMAAFIAMTSWQGEFTEEYFARSTPDPAQFGMPTEDDGSRDDPLLSDRSAAVTSYGPDFDALASDLGSRSATGERLEFGRGRNYDPTLPCGLDDRPGERVFGVRFGCGCDSEHVFGCEPGHRLDVGQHWSTSGERAGLVEDHQVEVACSLESQPVLDQQAVARAERRADRDHEGDREPEGMRTGNHEHRRGAHKRTFAVPERPPDDEGDDPRGECHVEEQRRGPVGEGLRARPRGLCRRDQTHDARQRRCLSDRCDAHTQTSTFGHGSGDDRCTRVLWYGARLACDH